MEKKLKVLAVSDLHGSSALAERMARKARDEKVDLVLLCGDIVGWAETRNIIKPFVDKKQKVLFVPGNHESFATADFLASLYNVKNIHGYSAIYNGVGIFGAGGADLSPGFITDEELASALEKAHMGLKGVEKKIMVTHMHPAGSKSEFSGFSGSDAIAKAIRKFQPDLVLHGHIHEGFGLEEKWGKTRIVNVGREGRVFEL